MAEVTISLPGGLLERIDREAERRGTTRSGLLQQAAQKELEDPGPTGIEAPIGRSRARFAAGQQFDSTELFRIERDQLARRHL